MSVLLNDIQKKYSSYTETERKIADFLLVNPKKAATANIKELSVLAQVSIASVTRFAQKLGCKNFGDFKLKLLSDDVKQDYPVSTLPLKKQYIEAIEESQRLMDEAIIKKVLNKINKSDRIYIFGLGSSGLAAQELNYRLSRMGIQSEAVTDPHLMMIRSQLLKSNDLIISFSRSGQTQDLIAALELGQKQNVAIIAITANGETPLTNLSDDVIWTMHPVKNHYISTGLDVSALYIVDVISNKLLEQRDYRKAYEKTVQVITEQHYN